MRRPLAARAAGLPPAPARLASVAAAALLLVLAAACDSRGPDDLGPTATVRRAPIERVVVATGTIAPENEIEVRSRISGIVEGVHVEPGQRVKRGEPLLEIERDLLEAQVREARAALQAARVESRYAAIELERVRSLSEREAASVRSLDEARARRESAEAQQARAAAALQSLEVQLAYTRVLAPGPARVLDVYVEEGDAVSAVTSVTGGSVLALLAGDTTLHLEGLVDENEIARVAVGQPARIRTEAYPERTFEGRVREIAPVGQREQNVTYFEVEVVVVDEQAGLLKPRMSADAEIVTEVVEDTRVVPQTALRYDGDRVYVETVPAAGASPNGGPVPMDVEVGIVDGDRVQLVAGPEEGTQVRLR